MPKREEFLKRLQAAFVADAAEHCEALSRGLLQLETAPEAAKRALIETIFRGAHSLKGAARAVNQRDVEAICQRLESVFEAWRRQPPRAAPGAYDALHRSVDVIRRLVEQPHEAEQPHHRGEISSLLKEIERLGIESPANADGIEESLRVPESLIPQPAISPAKRPQPRDLTVRVATDKMERILYATEELLILKSTMAQRNAELREAITLLDQWRREWSGAHPALHVTRERIANRESASAGERSDATALVELVDRGDVVNNVLTEKLDALARAFDQDRNAAGKLVDSLLDESKKLLLLPFETDSAYFSKVVRDLARDQGKEIEFVFRGREVEIDKRILQEMKDPLVHLLRNCIDHGMERPEERTRMGKPSRGTIQLTALQREDQMVEIQVEDDGAGISVPAVRAAAIRKGIMTEAAIAQLSDDEVLLLIFRGEMTTAPIVTEVSGRGLGLAIVLEKVEKLGGRVQVTTEPNRSTTFTITLPVALSTFRGVHVAVADQLFVVPAARVERVQRILVSEIKTVENRDTVLVNQRPTAFVWMADVLELARRTPAEPARYVELLVMGSAARRVAFGVDAILREEEVMVKPLRKPFCRTRNIAGATVLGSGAVVPILNVADLLKSAVAAGGRHKVVDESGAESPTRHSILVAEDSITSRLLLKNILESAGFTVKTATDGIDALTTLRSEPFDLVVSDVEMPRLNGFGLTAAIRADRKLADLPVILLTALASREDRERGIVAGANAYLVKSDFDQSNLLETIRLFV